MFKNPTELVPSTVQLLSVPEEGVPRAPPLTTKAPADPVLTPKAVVTPVPVVRPDTAVPVEA